MNKFELFAYGYIVEFYGKRESKRFSIPLINHIDEGLEILDYIGASENAMNAFCLHPMSQEDKILTEQLDTLKLILSREDPAVGILMMEYRSVANQFLKQHVRANSVPEDIYLGPIKSVKDMLIADKVQNKKSFREHHLYTHPDREVLNIYFDLWLKRLGVTPRWEETLLQALK
jgi:hypothetical protein